MVKVVRSKTAAISGDELLSVLPEGLIVIDDRGVIRFANDRAAGMFGRKPGQLVGMSFGVPVMDGDEVEIELDASLGSPGFASVSAVRAEWQGEPVYVATLREVSDLMLEKEEAQEKNAQKSAFIAELSHELRTPINAILGFSEMMETELFGALGHDKYREYAHDIHQCAAHVMEIANGILDLSKAEAGKLELRAKTVDIAALAAECGELISAAAKEKGVRTRISVPSIRMKLDPVKFRQILLNVLSNAIKFTPKGGKVEVRGFLLRSGEVRLRISDSGIGMNEKQLANLFEPFRQVHRKADVIEGQQGTGLGLVVMRRLVDLHGGQVSVESEPEKGTTVIVTLPASRVVPSRTTTVH